MESQHFSLYTDLARERALAEARHLERLFAGFEQSGWEKTKGTELKLRLNVVMFAEEHDLARYARDGVIGYHVPDVLYEPWVVVPAAGAREERLQTVGHELTHYMATAALPRQPQWFSEGLATYFQTGHFGDDGRFVLGSVPEGRFDELKYFGLLRPSVLLREEIKRDDQRFYASSWLLVHYLMTEQGYAFQEYQKGLARGLGYQHAWAQAFPALTGEGLDEKVEAYVLRGEYARFRIPFKEPKIGLRDRVLSRADEHALQAILWVANTLEESKNVRPHAERAIASALAQEPGHLLGTALRISLYEDNELARALSEARALCKRHPSEWLSLALLGEVAWQAREVIPEGRSCDVTQLVSMAPWRSHAWHVLATQQALRGEREHAVASSKRALDLQPASPAALWARADLLISLDECGPLASVIASLEQHDLSASGRKEIASLKARCNRPSEAVTRGDVPSGD